MTNEKKNPFTFNLKHFEDLDSLGGMWMDFPGPSEDELINIATAVNIELDDLQDCLDINENARFDWDENYNLVILRVPIFVEEENLPPTLPVGIFIHNNGKILTIHPKEVKMTHLISNLKKRDIKFSTQMELFFTLLNAINESYANILRKREFQINKLDTTLLKSKRGKAIEELFDLNRNLVYINTSILSNRRTIRVVKRSSRFVKNSELIDEIEDVIVDCDQLYVSSNIYRDILKGVSDSFVSVMSNNTNEVMRFLTIISLILMIPTLITSYYGMNVDLPLFEISTPDGGIIIAVITVVLTMISYFAFRRLKWI